MKNIVALALQWGWLSLKEAKTARIFSKVEAGASSKVNAINFREPSTCEISTQEVSQNSSVGSSFLSKREELGNKDGVSDCESEENSFSESIAFLEFIKGGEQAKEKKRRVAGMSLSKFQRIKEVCIVFFLLYDGKKSGFVKNREKS